MSISLSASINRIFVTSVICLLAATVMDHREYCKKRDPPMSKSFSQPAPGHNIDDVVK